MSAPTIHTDLTGLALETLDSAPPAPDMAHDALDLWARLRVAQRSCWQCEAAGLDLEEIEARRARIEALAERAWGRFQRRLQAQEGEDHAAIG